ncbi:MAG: hypothetical protein HQL36_11950, partial [Alphaproteobacteria bacterium]|nr:hypothetical protein [Alphaproteobacteria bacterium]
MALSPFEDIRVVLAEPSASLRRDIRDTLLAKGVRHIVDTGNMAQVMEALRGGAVDILIGDT